MTFSANSIEELDDYPDLLSFVDNGMPDPRPKPKKGVETFVRFDAPIFHGLCLVISMIFGCIIQRGKLGHHFFKEKYGKFKKYYTNACDRKKYKAAIEEIMKEHQYLINTKKMHQLRKGKKHVLKTDSKDTIGIVKLLADFYQVNVIVFTIDRNWTEIVYMYPGIPFDVDKPFVCLLQSTSMSGKIRKGHVCYIKVSKLS